MSEGIAGELSRLQCVSGIRDSRKVTAVAHSQEVIRGPNSDLYEDSQSKTFPKIVKLFACGSCYLDDSLPYLWKRLRVVEDGALRMPGAPQTAGKGVREGVDDIDMDKIERVVFPLNKVLIFAAHQLDIRIRRQSCQSLLVNILLIIGVDVPLKGVDPDDGIKIGR